MVKHLKNTKDDLHLLDIFLKDAGTSLNTFRYFGKRPLEEIESHRYTILVLDDAHVPVAYGHLDAKDGIVWLGICVSEQQVGKGYGKIIMTDLLNWADSEGISELTLQVDKVNVNAVSLYKKFNFITFKEKDGLYLIMKRTKNAG